MAPSTSEHTPTAPQRDQERGGVALLIIDMINCFDFAGADRLRPKVKRIIEPIRHLQDRAASRDVPIIYVNDNFGEWHSDRTRLVERAKFEAGEIVTLLAPKDEHYFIIKPQFSGFYATNLPLLLPKLGVSRLILTGIAADICVLFTAADAHMRDYALWVPENAVAAEHGDHARWALTIMRDRLGAEIASTDDLDLAAWTAALDERGVR